MNEMEIDILLFEQKRFGMVVLYMVNFKFPFMNMVNWKIYVFSTRDTTVGFCVEASQSVWKRMKVLCFRKNTMQRSKNSKS